MIRCITSTKPGDKIHYRVGGNSFEGVVDGMIQYVRINQYPSGSYPIIQGLIIHPHFYTITKIVKCPR